VYKVLIVDDEELIRNGINHLINWESLGCKVCATAANGVEGLDMIRTFRPEIVITDLKMPGKNGMELIAEAVTDNPRTKFIVLSGYEEFDFAKEVMKYGIKYYLLKPCDEDELVAHLKSVVA
jgi:two-component system response regulator YesN